MITIKNMRWVTTWMSKELTLKEEVLFRNLIEGFLLKEYSIMADLEVRKDG